MFADLKKKPINDTNLFWMTNKIRIVSYTLLHFLWRDASPRSSHPETFIPEPNLLQSSVLHKRHALLNAAKFGQTFRICFARGFLVGELRGGQTTLAYCGCRLP